MTTGTRAMMAMEPGSLLGCSGASRAGAFCFHRGSLQTRFSARSPRACSPSSISSLRMARSARDLRRTCTSPKAAAPRSLDCSSRRSDSSPTASSAKGSVPPRRSPSGRSNDPAASVIGSPRADPACATRSHSGGPSDVCGRFALAGCGKCWDLVAGRLALITFPEDDPHLARARHRRGSDRRAVHSTVPRRGDAACRHSLDRH
jgi:hypothetical protein